MSKAFLKKNKKILKWKKTKSKKIYILKILKKNFDGRLPNSGAPFQGAPLPLFCFDRRPGAANRKMCLIVKELQ